MVAAWLRVELGRLDSSRNAITFICATETFLVGSRGLCARFGGPCRIVSVIVLVWSLADVRLYGRLAGGAQPFHKVIITRCRCARPRLPAAGIAPLVSLFPSYNAI